MPKLLRPAALAAAAVLAILPARASPPRAAVPAPVALGYMPVGGIRMYYEEYGAGPPILLIPGGLSSARIWRPQIAALAARHLVIVADSRGQGRSTRTSETITYELMADDYVGLLDALDIKKTALVGWSDGGIIGIEIAVQHPERLTALFAQAANVRPGGVISNREARKAGKPRPELKHYDAVETEIQALWANEPHLSDDVLRRITVPTVIAIGEHDQAISRRHEEKIAAAIPGAKLLILPHVGHGAPVEDPDGYAGAVLAFVDGIAPAAAAAQPPPQH